MTPCTWHPDRPAVAWTAVWLREDGRYGPVSHRCEECALKRPPVCDMGSLGSEPGSVPEMPRPTPDTAELSATLQDLASSYARANQGSDEHPLGHAEVGPIADLLQRAGLPPPPPSVKGGFALRFPDGTTYLVNVHRMPAKT